MASDQGRLDVLLVGPLPPTQSYIGGIAVLLLAQLRQWSLPLSVSHLNTDLWARKKGTTGKVRVKHLLAFAWNGVRLTAAIVRRPPALVHYHSGVGLGLLKDATLAWWTRWVCRRFVVLQIHYSVAEVILLPGPPGWRRFQLRFIMGACDRLILLSEGVRKDLAALLSERQRTRFYAKTNVLANFIEAVPEHKPRAAGGGEVSLFFIGNLGARKGVYELLSAAERLAASGELRFRLVLAGPFDSQDDEARMRGMVQASGLSERVSFLGPVAGEGKHRAFVEADVFVLPSRGEGVPMSMLEAMAYGLPLVVTPVGGIPETITDGVEGLLVPAMDIEALAGALRRLVLDPELRRRMGEAGRTQLARRHSPQAHFGALRAIYDACGAFRGRLS